MNTGIIPDFSKQSGVFEKDDPKLHLCNAQFEGSHLSTYVHIDFSDCCTSLYDVLTHIYAAYSAAWLTTREHVIEVKSETFNLTWVNCEMASFIHMRDSNNFYKNPHGKGQKYFIINYVVVIREKRLTLHLLPGMIIQSLDVLDFAVIHLSTYERSNKKYMRKLWTDKNERKEQWSKIGNCHNNVSIVISTIAKDIYICISSFHRAGNSISNFFGESKSQQKVPISARSVQNGCSDAVFGWSDGSWTF